MLHTFRNYLSFVVTFLAANNYNDVNQSSDIKQHNPKEFKFKFRYASML